MSVLALGVVATAATSPPPEVACPSSTDATPVSAFFGQQDTDEGPQPRWAGIDDVHAGPFRLTDARVHVPSCVATHSPGGPVPVRVTLSLTDDGTGPALDAYLTEAVLVDGDQRVWPLRELEVDGPDGDLLNGLPVLDAQLSFDLPLDVTEPVVLQLPDPDGSGLQYGPVGPIRL